MMIYIDVIWLLMFYYVGTLIYCWTALGFGYASKTEKEKEKANLKTNNAALLLPFVCMIVAPIHFFIWFGEQLYGKEWGLEPQFHKERREK